MTFVCSLIALIILNLGMGFAGYITDSTFVIATVFIRFLLGCVHLQAMVTATTAIETIWPYAIYKRQVELEIVDLLGQVIGPAVAASGYSLSYLILYALLTPVGFAAIACIIVFFKFENADIKSPNFDWNLHI